MKYKVHIFYNNWRQKELKKEFNSSDQALRSALVERIKLNKVFAIIIYRRKKYLDNFQSSKGLSILEFFKNIEYTYFCLEDKPPIVLSLDEMNKDEVGIYIPNYEGYELSGAQIIIFYSGDLDRDSIFVLTLHEAGHAVTDIKTKLKYEHYTIYHELSAWLWAKRQCKSIKINNFLFKKLARECLSTYIKSEMEKNGKLKGCGMPRKTFWKKYRELTKFDIEYYDLR